MTNSDSRLTDDFSDSVEITNTSGRFRVALEVAVAALILVGIYFLFAPEETIELEPPIQESQIDPVIRGQIEAAKESEQAPQVSSSPVETEKVPESEEQHEEVGDTIVSQAEPVAAVKQSQESETAREMISKLRSGELALSPTELLEKSELYAQQGRHTDTYLLLFYAAREGDGQAAFALASLYDPDHFKEGNVLLEKADIFQAHKWYREAAKQQIVGAQERLDKLRRRSEQQAKSGDPSAQRLLLNWQ
ncbi:MAG: hypothetical protein ABW105_20630 [Candidatus Thiodiazotropha sp. 6PLUC1]